MTADVTPEIVQHVGRAIRDPIIGGWPLIHWEWLFSDDHAENVNADHHARGIEVIGAWPDSEDRQVTLRFHPETGNPDHRLKEH